MSHTTNQIALLLALALGLGPGQANGGPTPRTPATFEHLKVGQVISVDGQPAGARTLVARKIKIEKAPELDKLKGRIQTLRTNDRSLMLLGVRVIVAPEAVIVDREGGPLSWSDLQKGSVVKAKGELKNGALHATELKVDGPEATDSEVQGKVQAVDTDRRTLTVIGFTIRVTGDTKISSE